MHTLFATRLLMILLCVGITPHMLYCDGDIAQAIAFDAFVNGKGGSLATPSMPMSIPNSGEMSKEDESIKKLKEEDRLLRIYGPHVQGCLDFFSEEIDQRIELLNTINKIKKLLKDNSEKEYADKESNKKFIGLLNKLKCNTLNINEQCIAIKKEGADIIVSDINKAEFNKLINTLETISENYYNDFQGKIMLFGPPGNGKSMWIQQLAVSKGCSEIVIKGSELINEYQNSGAERLNKYFKSALEKADKMGKPVILRIDEVDAIVSNRATTDGQVYRSATQTLLQWVYEMCNDPRVVIGITTSRPKSLHDALRNRYSNHNRLLFDNPNLESRKQLLAHFIKQRNIADSIPSKAIKVIAQKSNNLSNRDLAGLVDAMAVEVALSNNGKAPLTIKRCLALLNEARSQK